MKVTKYIGKALLIVTLPVAFCVVSTIVISLLFASMGALMNYNTFQVCFQKSLECVVVGMSFITIIGTFAYLALEEGS